MSSALERRFPSPGGESSLFPPRKGGGGADTGLIKAFSMTYPDRTLFSLGTRMLPWQAFPKMFIEDRSRFAGVRLDPAVIEAAQPQTASTLCAHMARFFHDSILTANELSLSRL
jgi:hypothetical protein